MELRVEHFSDAFFQGGKSAKLYLGDDLLGFVGVVDGKAAKAAQIRSDIAVAELDVSVLKALCTLIPQHVAHSTQPAIAQDVNFVVAESVTWADLRGATTTAAGDLLDSVQYRETYRNAEQDGEGQKRVLFTLTMQSKERTLTMEEANEIRNRAVAKIESDFGGKLVQ